MGNVLASSIGGFKWMTYFENWQNIPCILEVDLEYLKELLTKQSSQRLFTCRWEVDDTQSKKTYSKSEW